MLNVFPLSIHVIFGHVISGFELIREVENQKTDSNHKPYADVRIAACGELVKKTKTDKPEKGAMDLFHNDVEYVSK